jgi:hypothetical protein
MSYDYECTTIMIYRAMVLGCMYWVSSDIFSSRANEIPFHEALESVQILIQTVSCIYPIVHSCCLYAQIVRSVYTTIIIAVAWPYCQSRPLHLHTPL